MKKYVQILYLTLLFSLLCLHVCIFPDTLLFWNTLFIKHVEYTRSSNITLNTKIKYLKASYILITSIEI